MDNWQWNPSPEEQAWMNNPPQANQSDYYQQQYGLGQTAGIPTSTGFGSTAPGVSQTNAVYEAALAEYKKKLTGWMWKTYPGLTASNFQAIFDHYWGIQMDAIKSYADKVYGGMAYLTDVPVGERDLVDIYLKTNTDWTGVPTAQAKQQADISQWENTKQSQDPAEVADFSRAKLIAAGYDAEQVNNMGDTSVTALYNGLVQSGQLSFAVTTTPETPTTPTEETGTATYPAWMTDMTKSPDTVGQVSPSGSWEWDRSLQMWQPGAGASGGRAAAQPTTQLGWGKQWTQNPTTGAWGEGPMSASDQLAQAQWANLPENWYQVAALEKQTGENKYAYQVPNVVSSLVSANGAPVTGAAAQLGGATSYKTGTQSGQGFGAMSDVDQRQLQGWFGSGLAGMDWQSYQDKVKEQGAPSGYSGWLRYRR